MTRSMRLRDDAGVFAVLYALLVVMLCVVAALVVDIGGLRMDRRYEREASDAAVTAGAAYLNPGDPASAMDACRNAFEYARQNLNDAGTTFTMPDCAALMGQCTASTLEHSVSGTAGRYTITITYPVRDGSSLLHPDVAPGFATADQPANSSYDGTACQRLSVAVAGRRDFILASVNGFKGTTTSVHSVARTDVVGSRPVLAPLVILDPYHCNTLTTSGQGDLEVLNNVNYPGIIAVDSDGTKDGNPLKCDNPNAWVIDSMGTTNGRILAFPGADGSAAAIYSYALLGSRADRAYDPSQVLGCTPAAPATGTAKVCPKPTALGERITRKPWDDRYGAWIAGQRALYASTTLNAASGWTVVSGNKDCGTGGQTDQIYSGKIFLNCSTFTAKANIGFAAGSTVVFAGSVNVTGCLAFNTTAATPAAACDQTTTPTSTSDMVVYLRAGDGHGNLTKTAQGTFVAPRTTIIQTGDDSTTNEGRFDLGAGSGRIYWTPASDAASPAHGLSYWSEGRSYPHDGDPSNLAPHSLGGQANVTMVGVMFMPNAQVEIGGASGLNQIDAQFVAYRLDYNGQGTLLMKPDPGNMLSIPIVGVHLIR